MLRDSGGIDLRAKHDFARDFGRCNRHLEGIALGASDVFYRRLGLADHGRFADRQGQLVAISNYMSQWRHFDIETIRLSRFQRLGVAECVDGTHQQSIIAHVRPH